MIDEQDPEGPNARPVRPADAARYIADLTHELEALAAAQALTELAVLLRAAARQAAADAVRKGAAGWGGVQGEADVA